MLLLPDLIAFSESFVAERPNIENNLTVMDDEEAGTLYKDVVNSGNLCTLITVVPTHDSATPDEDNALFKNNAIFLIIKKIDERGGNQQKLDRVAICQQEVLAFAQKIKSLKANFGSNCIFSDIDLESIQVTPLNNYFKGAGYAVEFSTSTGF